MTQIYFQIRAQDVDGLTLKYLTQERFQLRWDVKHHYFSYGLLSPNDSWEFLQYIKYMLSHRQYLQEMQDKYGNAYPTEMLNLMSSVQRRGQVDIPKFI